MKETTIDQTLVLCDLDSLLLDAAGNLPQLQRDVLQLFASRGGRLTVFLSALAPGGPLSVGRGAAQCARTGLRRHTGLQLFGGLRHRAVQL